jgi:hypothetical protein
MCRIWGSHNNDYEDFCDTMPLTVDFSEERVAFIFNTEEQSNSNKH